MSKYEFLGTEWHQPNYLPPELYDSLLKPYSFNGVEDIELLGEFISQSSKPRNILELGFGTGRSLPTLNHLAPHSAITAVDLSETMNTHVASSENAKEINIIQSDSLKYLDTSEEQFDLIFSLWSLSHSIHDNLKADPTPVGKEALVNRMVSFWRDNFSQYGRGFIIHFDSRSEEQRVLAPTWAKLNSFFDTNDGPSHSLKVLLSSLEKASSQNYIDFRISNRRCDPIVFDSLNSTLEAFVNFHLEGSLQRHMSLLEAEKECNEISARLEPYVQIDGTVTISPRAYVIEIFRSRI